MLETLRNAFKIKDLRKKIFYTLFIIFIFRLGSRIPVPFLDPSALAQGLSMDAENTVFFLLNTFSGGAFQYGAIFAMSVTPYINSSIIMQLLTVAIPALERMQKEGEEGRKKIAQITRYVTVVLGLLQGLAFYFYLKSAGIVYSYSGFWAVFAAVVIILAFTAGTALMMWLGEQINDKGIGNGISILLFAGILSRGPQAFLTLYYQFSNGIKNSDFTQVITPIGVIILFLLVTAFIVFMTDAERRIRIQYAKKVVGRKMYGGQTTHMPIKVNIGGVIPIIFASTVLALPSTIISFSGMNAENSNFWYPLLNFFAINSVPYIILYMLFIFGFSYFYVTIQYNPLEMSNNLRRNNGAVPGIRPGKPTADYIKKILSRITFNGAIFLTVIALLPIIAGLVSGTNGTGITIGGTSMLIMVGVALETVKAIESQMMMRHYKGFLD